VMRQDPRKGAIQMESFAGVDLHKRVTHQQPGLDRFLQRLNPGRSSCRPAFITARQRPPSRVQRADLRLPPSKALHSHSRVLHPPWGRRVANRRKLWRGFFRPLRACLFQDRCHRPGETRRIANPVRCCIMPMQ